MGWGGCGFGELSYCDICVGGGRGYRRSGRGMRRRGLFDSGHYVVDVCVCVFGVGRCVQWWAWRNIVLESSCALNGW